MSDEVDEAVLACARLHWTKVARLLAIVSARLAASEEAPRFDEIASRIQGLAAVGARARRPVALAVQ